MKCEVSSLDVKYRKGKKVVLLKKRGSCLEGCVKSFVEGIECLRHCTIHTKFALIQSEIFERSEIRCSVASLQDLLTS